MIQLENISKEFSKREVSKLLFSNLNLSIPENHRIALIGPSGSGKSTLAKIIAGFDPHFDGNYYFNNHLHSQMPNREIQLIFQNPFDSLTPHLTIQEILLDPFSNKEKIALEPKINYFLTELKLHTRHLNAYPYQLSGGEAQRVALLRSLLVEPKMLICDEVLASVDVMLQKEILQLILNLQAKNNFSVLWITHDLILARKFCTQLLLLNEGRLVQVSNKMCSFLDSDEPYLKEIVASMRWILGENPK